jgi:hypothetical protein
MVRVALGNSSRRHLAYYHSDAVLCPEADNGQHRGMQPTFSATGSSSSMKGTTRNTVSGTSRKMSALVRVSCRCSRLCVRHDQRYTRLSLRDIDRLSWQCKRVQGSSAPGQGLALGEPEHQPQ